MRKMCVKVGFLFPLPPPPLFFYNIITPPVLVLLLLLADHMFESWKQMFPPPPEKQDMKSNSVANDFILGLECRKYGYKTSSFFCLCEDNIELAV